MPPRKTPADYHALAEERGFRWLGPEVPNTQTKTSWECEDGHQWEAVYNSIQRGSGCPFCAGTAPKTPADYHALAEERGFQWLGPEVTRVIIKTGWRCEEGHEWEASYNGIQQGKGCPVCAGNVQKTPADYQTLAQGRGLQWLGPNVPNTATKTSWQCADGHQWDATYNNIQQGKGCPHCAGIVPKSPEDYHALAEQRGFRWLGPEVPNIQTKTTWECADGHQWEAIYNSIQRGTGCPVCAGTLPKTPEDYHSLAEQRGFHWLGPEVPNVRTNTCWECEEGHTWEAIYDNIARGRGCPVCAGKLQKMPEDYHALAQERGFSWLGPEVPNVKTNTWWECELGHQWENPYVYLDSGSGCPICADSVPKTPADYHALAQRRGHRWLGPMVSSIAIGTRWECDEGHRWEAPYYKVRIGWGCPVCDERLPKVPEDYHTLAEERGFRWLGPEVPNVNTSTSWECEQGHQWETPYCYIRAGTGCPVCAGKEPKTPADYHALAAERGFRWMGSEVPTVTTKTVWECEQGHQWEAHFHNIRHGRGCPHCIDMVHGARVSQIQRDLCKMLGGELNKPFGSYNIDVALQVNDVPIAVEYDCWYWHAGREGNDAQRDEAMISEGWRILRVKSSAQLPATVQLETAIDRLLAGENYVEIVLDDWGIGPTRFEID